MHAVYTVYMAHTVYIAISIYLVYIKLPVTVIIFISASCISAPLRYCLTVYICYCCFLLYSIRTHTHTYIYIYIYFYLYIVV